MTDKEFRTSIAIMLFAMVSVVTGAWVAAAVTPAKVAPTPSQLTI